MLDERFEEDTLFLVFEEDYRFAKPGTSANLRPEGFHQMFEERTYNVVYKDGRRYVTLDRGVSETHMIPTRASSAAFKEELLPTFLKDTLRYATLAARKKCGDLIWWSWNAAQPGQETKHATRINYGSQFISYTRAAAKQCLEDMEKGVLQMGHWDISLKTYLKNNTGDTQYSYLYPPMDHFEEHASDCDPRQYAQGRPSDWDKSWVCQGTRVDHDRQKRSTYFCFFSVKGNTVWGPHADPAVDSAAHNWRTFIARDSVSPDRSCALPNDQGAEGSALPFNSPYLSADDLAAGSAAAVAGSYQTGGSSSSTSVPFRGYYTHKRQDRQIKSARYKQRNLVEDRDEACVLSLVSFRGC